MTFLVSVMILVPLLGPFVASKLSAVIETSSGPVRGLIASTLNGVGYAAFLGIRYAEPPVKHLRFKPPVRTTPWTDTLIATNEGNVCPQYNAEQAVIGDEDCLFLNVFTPVTNLSQIPTVRKSVMVWIHEGSFAEGSGNMNTKKPDFLIERDVVLVSMNYRLGALGFLSLNHPEATGNQGLKDQKLALEWVQKNIEKFGGDPQSVTIFGKDAGAASVGYHVLSDASEGLFHATISMSGTPLGLRSFVSQAEAIRRGSKLAALIGSKLSPSFWTKKASLQALCKATPAELVVNTFYVDQNSPFVPTVENPTESTDVFLSDNPISKYKSGHFNKVPQLLGVMVPHTEHYVFNTKDFTTTIDKSIENIQSATGRVPAVLSYFKKMADHYARKGGDRPAKLDEWAAYVEKDAEFEVPMQLTQRLLVENIGEKPVYYYRFAFTADESSHSSEGHSILHGVTYPEDLACIFYIPSTGYDLSRNSQTGQIIHSVSTMWTNFAKYGDPTPDPFAFDTFGIAWPPSGSSGSGILIGNKFEVVSTPMNILFDPTTPPYIDLFH